MHEGLARATIMALALPVALGSCTAPSGEPSVRLLQPGDTSGAGWVEWGLAPGDPYVELGSIRVCVDRPGEVTITGITFAEADGVSVQAVATAAADVAVTYESPPDSQRLSDTRWDPSQRDVSTVCPTGWTDDGAPVDGDLTWLAVELRKESTGVSSGVTMQVHYTTDGTDQVLPIDVFFALCETEVECREWDADHAPW